jgi:hypothetical protein
MDRIKVIKYPVGSDPLVVEIDDDLDAMQAQVGGMIQIVEVDGMDLVCNEEGLVLNLPFNRVVGGHYIHGDFFLARHDDEGNTTTVTKDDIKRLVR